MKKPELSDLFSELKTEYLDSFDEKIQFLTHFWQTGNLAQLQNEYHKIKGTGTTYGVTEATEVAELMEDLCLQKSPSLGLAVLLSIELLQMIRANHRQNKTTNLHAEKNYLRIKESLIPIKKSA